MPPSSASRSLTTVLFTDIVGSTAKAAELGDRAWSTLLDQHNAIAREQLRRCAGDLMRTTGDGMLAVFDGPAAAIEAALGFIGGARELGLGIRAGVHTGECERQGDELVGIAVHVAARIAAVASDGEVVVSKVVRDLAAGSGIAFTAHSTRVLKGVPGRWQLLLATRPADMPTTIESGLPRVLLVDDHPLWRQSLVELIERRRVGAVIAEAGDGAEAVELAAKAEPDVIVMDVALPVLDGIAATRRILSERPSVRIVMLSSSDERSQVLECVKAGASGYLLKTAGSDEILDAVRRVHRGEAVFPPALASYVLDEIRHGSPESSSAGGLPESREPLQERGLTPRELAVLELMAAGRSNQAICDQLHLSHRTVETHVTSIFNKLSLQPAADDHRRVLAVLTYLRSLS